uniref:Uncharacterized protein n=1 Tax=Rhizophora mucronata TaxID=61149 RepID=A0A2P2LI63_RHIMU
MSPLVCVPDLVLLIYTDVTLTTWSSLLSMQVRLGTERGSAIVKVSVMALYSLLLAFALSKAVPFTCIVSLC